MDLMLLMEAMDCSTGATTEPSTSSGDAPA